MKERVKTKVPILGPILAHEGFTTEVQSTQKFDIVCITKTNEVTGEDRFHLPVTFDDRQYHPGIEEEPAQSPTTMKATVKHVIDRRDDIVINRTVVEIGGKDYDLSYIRNGLGGSALVIGIRNLDEPPYSLWCLYTDTPSAKPDRPDDVITKETIHEEAGRMIHIRLYGKIPKAVA